MTKQDYKLIAEAIKKHLDNYTEYYTDSEENYHLGEFIKTIANSLQKDNDRFDRTKFLSACGMEI